MVVCGGGSLLEASRRSRFIHYGVDGSPGRPHIMERRDGLVKKKYPWGNKLTYNGEHHCNIWQGKFPVENTVEDSYLSTAPVDAFSPNGFGLYNVSGNVWEWCSDWFSKVHSQAKISNDPAGPEIGTAHVMKGEILPMP